MNISLISIHGGFTLAFSAFCAPLRLLFVGVTVALAPSAGIMYTWTKAFGSRLGSLALFLVYSSAFS